MTEQRYKAVQGVLANGPTGQPEVDTSTTVLRSPQHLDRVTPSNQSPGLTTDRLVLRHWRDRDRGPFAQLNADPLVMEHFPGVLTREESDGFVERIEAHFESKRFGLWAVELKGKADFIGFVGLSTPGFDAPFMPAVEVGWRLARAYWGRGFATEAARAAVADGFDRIGLNEIVSFTVPANTRSIRVMERLDMTRNPLEDFDHPRLPAGHHLQRHVLYRLSRASWLAGR